MNERVRVKNTGKMKKETIKNKKHSKGITLIALVVTIVVLLILAGVTISTLFGENGIISAARKAAEDTKKSEEDTENNIGSILDQMNAALLGIKTAEKGKLVSKNDRYAIYTDEDKKTAPIPGGYCVVNNYTRNGVEDINKIDTGLVISSVEGDDLNNTKQGNQFVWVPVSDEQLSTMYGTDSSGKKWGKLYNFTSTGKTNLNWTETDRNYYINSNTQSYDSFREPDVLTGNDGGYDSSYYDIEIQNLIILGFTSIDEFKTELETSFNNMIESVKKYKGFYIGRYETGKLEANKYNVAVVRKGETIEGKNWYYQYQGIKNISNDNENIVTNIIWGCQYDRTLDWIANTNEGGYSLLTNASSWSNNGNKQPSGSNETWQKNHIYDLGGNVAEWTMEANHSGFRTVRRKW